MDKVALGRQGEIFVMQKLLERGWIFPKDYHESMHGLDWVFEKNNRVIRVQVKTSLKGCITFNITNKDVDYLIITNLKECFIIPKILIGNGNKLTKTFKRCSEKYNLLDFDGRKLVNEVNDCRIPFRKMNMHELWQIA